MDKNKTDFYFTAFNKLKKAYLEFAKDELNQYDLSPNEIEVISTLSQNMCGSDVAKKFDVSKTLVSRSVATLSKKGFLTTETGSDKREKILCLTENGKCVYQEIQLMKENFFKKVFRHFEERELLVLEALLKLLLKNTNSN